jgi:hypothetical protein
MQTFQPFGLCLYTLFVIDYKRLVEQGQEVPKHAKSRYGCKITRLQARTVLMFHQKRLYCSFPMLYYIDMQAVQVAKCPDFSTLA